MTHQRSMFKQNLSCINLQSSCSCTRLFRILRTYYICRGGGGGLGGELLYDHYISKSTRVRVCENTSYSIISRSKYPLRKGAMFMISKRVIGLYFRGLKPPAHFTTNGTIEKTANVYRTIGNTANKSDHWKHGKRIGPLERRQTCRTIGNMVSVCGCTVAPPPPLPGM